LVDDLDEHVTTLSFPEEFEEGMRLEAVIIGDGISQTVLLPQRGDVRIGRYIKSDIHIDHASISRFHAVLHLGPPLAVEDLGSSNGTKVRGNTVRAGKSEKFALGDPVKLGSVIMIVQRRSQSMHSR
jgi:pSer/pThr/pTyr-binding forkhead associated (FHA) protein